MTPATQRLAGLLAPLDTLRSGLLRALGPRVAPWLRDRAARVALVSSLSVVVALVGASREPLLVATCGPLILGVPHLLADVRYLVAQPALHRRRELQLCIAPALIAVACSPSAAHALALVAFTALLARCSPAKKLPLSALALAVSAVCRLDPQLADVCFAHAHNFGALALWWWFARGTRGQVAPALVLFAVGTACLLFLPAAQLPLSSHALSPSHFRIDASRLLSESSRTDDSTWALRGIMFFAFAQSVHYALWLRVIPEEARAQRAPRPFRASLYALTTDVGLPLTVLFVGLTIYVAARGLLAPELTRDDYLRFAYVHGPLELCAGVVLALEGRRPWQPH